MPYATQLTQIQRLAAAKMQDSDQDIPDTRAHPCVGLGPVLSEGSTPRKGRFDM